MTFYPANVLWLLFASVGIIIGVLLIVDARLDLKALKIKRVDGQKKVIAVVAIWSESGRLLIQIIFIGIGIWSVSQPPPRDPNNIFSWLLVIVSAIMNVNSVASYISKRVALSLPDI